MLYEVITGESLCCATFLKDFTPVTIRMAKDQGLALNPSKISGVCGRLMCCLQYEHDNYRKMIKPLPKVGARIETPDGVITSYSIHYTKLYDAVGDAAVATTISAVE